MLRVLRSPTGRAYRPRIGLVPATPEPVFNEAAELTQSDLGTIALEVECHPIFPSGISRLTLGRSAVGGNEMPVVQRRATDRPHRPGQAASTSLARYGAPAAVIAAVGVLGLSALLAAALVTIMELMYSPDGWSSVLWGGR